MNDKNPSWHGTVPDFPDLYDILHGDKSSDVKLYLSECQNCEAILECGAGTGRITLPLARAGFKVHAIDTSPLMLSQLSSKLASEAPEVQRRVSVSETDMRNVNLGRTFQASIIPYMTFNYLGSIEDQVACLSSIHRHLEKGSPLILELVSMYPPWFHNDGMLRLVKRVVFSEIEETIEIWRVTRFDASTQIMEHDRYFRRLDGSGLVIDERRTTLRNRFFFLGEAELLLQKTGFRIIDTWGDHERGPYHSDSQVMVLKAVAL